MPKNKLKYSCKYPGCPNLVDQKERYCSYHKKIINKLYALKRENKDYYSQTKWRKIRKNFLEKYTYCFYCGKIATEVDHIIPLSKSGTNDEWNLQSLCKSCHSRKTAKEGSRWGRG